MTTKTINKSLRKIVSDVTKRELLNGGFHSGSGLSANSTFYSNYGVRVVPNLKDEIEKLPLDQTVVGMKIEGNVRINDKGDPEFKLDGIGSEFYRPQQKINAYYKALKKAVSEVGASIRVLEMGSRVGSAGPIHSETLVDFLIYTKKK